MPINTNLEKAFYSLEQHYGSHAAAAKAIGYTTQHYRGLRNGRYCISDRTADYILLKAAEIAAPNSPPPSPPTGPDHEPSISA